MRVGFLISLCDQIERFEPVLRRTPGSRFLVGPGRWPSAHRDSRAEIIRRLGASGLAPVISPRPEFDLVVAGSEIPENSIRAWLRPRGTRVHWREADAPAPLVPSALLLCGGEGSRPPQGAGLVECVGDPALDAATEPATRSRTRQRLGLGEDLPVLLVHGEEPAGNLDALATAVATLRTEFRILVGASERRRLRVRSAVPPALRGPGILHLPPETTRAEALAACDLVLAEPGLLLVQAAALGIPGLALGHPAMLREFRELELPIESALRGLEWITDPGELAARVRWLLSDGREYLQEAQARAQRVLGLVDGGATRRTVSALQLLAAGTSGPGTLSRV